MNKLFWIVILIIAVACGGTVEPQTEQEIDIVSTQVASTLKALENATDIPAPTEAPTKPAKESEEEIVEPTEPIKTVIFICEECVDEDGILPITLWQTPDESGEAGNYVYHLDQCKLLDEAISTEGIELINLNVITTHW